MTITATLPTEEEALAANAVLEQALDNNDPGAFRDGANDLFKKIGALKERLATENEAGLEIKSATNGAHTTTLRKTSNEEWRHVLGETRSASEKWRQVPIEARGDFFKVLSARMNARKEVFKTILATDVGKSVSDGAGEIKKACEWMNWVNKPVIQNTIRTGVKFLDGSDAEIDKKDALKPGGTLNTEKVKGLMVETHNAEGNYLVLTSYNYPIALSFAGIVPALMAGNSVTFKPSQYAPHWAFAFQEVFTEALSEWAEKYKDAEWFSKAGLDASDNGVKTLSNNLFRIVVGRNDDFTKEVDGVFLVGSDDTHHKLKNLRGDKKIIAELGGNSMATVMKSAVETNEEAESVAGDLFKGAASMAGQRCTAARLLTVDEAANPHFIKTLEKLYESAAANIGNPFKKGITTGALVEEESRNKMVEAIEFAKLIGANVISAGEAGHNQRPTGGFYVNPVLIDWTTEKAHTALHDEVIHEKYKQIVGSELFAPVLHMVHKVKDVSEAAKLADVLDKEKLAAAIYTKDYEEYTQFDKLMGVGSVNHLSAPKDRSPDGPHGNFDHLFRSGGSTGLVQYTKAKVSTPKGEIAAQEFERLKNQLPEMERNFGRAA